MATQNSYIKKFSEGQSMNFTILAGVAIIASLVTQRSYAEWYNDFDNQVALSSDGSVTFTCPPPDLDYIGPNFGIFIEKEIPAIRSPQLRFFFDNEVPFVWSDDFGAELYVGPVVSPYDSSSEILGYIAELRFLTDRRAISWWVKLGSMFMLHNEVTIEINGVSHGPIPLTGSSAALRHITYLTPPC